MTTELIISEETEVSELGGNKVYYYTPPTTVERLERIARSLQSIKWEVESLYKDARHSQDLDKVKRLIPSIRKIRFDLLHLDVVKAKGELDPSSNVCPIRKWPTEPLDSYDES